MATYSGKKKALQYTFQLILCALFFLLNACGGDSSSRIPEEERPIQERLNIQVDSQGNVTFENTGEPITDDELASLPKVNAGLKHYVDANVIVRLRGTAIPAQGASIATTYWVQIVGPTIELPDPTNLTSVFIAPDVSEPTLLRFRLLALDSEGRGNSSTVSVLVQPQTSTVRVVGGNFNESSGQALFKILLNTASGESITARYTTQVGSAAEDTDYLPSTGEVIFEPGETEKSVVVVINTDEDEEGLEWFFLSVTLTAGATGASNIGAVLILNASPPGIAQRVRIVEGALISIAFGDELVLNGVATDTSGGDLPDASLSWESNYDGVLAAGPLLRTGSLTRGAHDITFTARDGDGAEFTAQIRVLVGVENIALDATASASTTFPGFAPGNVNDGSTNTAVSPSAGWANDDNVSFPQWLTLAWEGEVLITNVDLYTSSGLEIQDFDFQYWNGTAWVTFTAVDDNTNVHNTYGRFDIRTNIIRVLARSGSSQQSTSARINELEVYGVPPLQDLGYIPFTATIGSVLTDPELNLYSLDLNLKIDPLGLNHWYSASPDSSCEPGRVPECETKTEILVTDTSITHQIDQSTGGDVYAWLENPERTDWNSATTISAFRLGSNAWSPLFRSDSRIISFKNAMWLFYGGNRFTDPDGRSSFDGLQWTLRSSLTPFLSVGDITEHNNQLYLINNGDFYRSEDGMVWESLTPPYSGTRNYEVLYSFNGFLWSFSGVNEDIGFRLEMWRYSQTTGWTDMTGVASFPNLINASVAVFDGRVWFIGGDLHPDLENPITTAIWSSTDGLGWQELTTANISFDGRYGHELVVFNNQLWSLGGRNESLERFDQPWRTADGETWIEGTRSAGYSPYSLIQATVFDNKIWVYVTYLTEGGTRRRYYSSENGIDLKQIHYNFFTFSEGE